MADYDVVVLGSGAAGLTAALAAHDSGARVGLFEKADQVGGTSAWSGGMVWVPNNPRMPDLGLADSREEALTYLDALSHGLIDEALAAAFVDTGPELVEWLAAKTPVRLQIVAGFPDYHPEHPGGKPGGGRSLECALFPFADLGEWADRVTTGYQLSGNILMSETSLGRGAPQGVEPSELARRKVRDERGGGQALVGRLLKGCLDRGLVPVTGARAVSLVRESTSVTGVWFESATGPFEVSADSVVIATGGFEWDAEQVRAFLRGPMARPVSVPTNTGDGLRMAMRVGAGLGDMREAWWVPAIDVTDPARGTVAWQVNGERSKPHCIMVNRRGERFTNEAANYNAIGSAFHVVDVSSFDYLNHPAWMVFDHHYFARYGLARRTADQPLPDWLVRADSIEELAGTIDVPEDALVATVARWNGHAASGRDPDFHRGESVYDRWWGDQKAGEGARSTIGPVDTPPFYAVRVYCGALGTKGGPRTDVHGRVLDVDGEPIAGLYAAGNAMASVLGMTYGGAGGTLGPAMTFGYLAGRHAAGVRVESG
ncbi:FAD-dependent oxidoreductase [Actinophytocola sp.]|uniref:FAD-dependent oxidoreductase n=1 Tax=Actinophytocola sp. TaxID=1872138 RepID=UPI002ED5A90C